MKDSKGKDCWIDFSKSLSFAYNRIFVWNLSTIGESPVGSKQNLKRVKRNYICLKTEDPPSNKKNF